MGCFGINGSISRLPIVYGDKCMLLIGLYDTNSQKDIITIGGSDTTFTPIALPIYGIYNDYGIICDIVHDDNVDNIEKFFNCPIEKLIYIIDCKNFGRYLSKSDTKLYDKFKENFESIGGRTYELALSIEHRFVYETLCKLKTGTGIDVDKSFEYTLQIPYTYEQIAKSDDYGGTHISLFDVKAIFNKIRKEKGYDYTAINLNPIYKDGLYDLYNSYHLLNVYCNEGNVEKLLVDLRNEYSLFIKFYTNMRFIDWTITPHVYSGQNGKYNLQVLKDLYKEYVSFIEQSNID